MVATGRADLRRAEPAKNRRVAAEMSTAKPKLLRSKIFDTAERILLHAREAPLAPGDIRVVPPPHRALHLTHGLGVFLARHGDLSNGLE
jgi:hypothetical protein